MNLSNSLLGSRKFTLKALLVFLLKATSASLSLALTWVMAARFGAAVSGVFFLSLSIVMICSILIRWGFDNIVLREVALAVEGGREEFAGEYNAIVSLIAVSSLTLGCVLFFLSKPISYWLFEQRYDSLIYLIVISIFPTAAYHLNAYFLQGAGQSIFFTLIINTLFPAGVLCFLLLWPGMLDVFLLVYVIPVFALLIYVYSRFLVNRIFSAEREKKFFHYTALYRFLHPARFFYSIAIANLSTTWLYMLIIGIFLTPASVGIYNASFRLALAVGFFAISSIAVAAPRFATFYANGEMLQLENFGRLVGRFVLVLSLAPLLCLFFAPSYILGFFGADFAKGSTALQIICLGQLISVFCGPVQTLLSMTGHEKYLSRVTISGAVIGLLVAIVMIPVIGISGAAAANSCALIYQNLGAYVGVRKLLGINVTPLSLGHRKV